MSESIKPGENNDRPIPSDAEVQRSNGTTSASAGSEHVAEHPDEKASSGDVPSAGRHAGAGSSTDAQSAPSGVQLPSAADMAILADSRRRTRRAFLVGGVAAAAGAGFYRWLDTEPADGNQPMLLRKTFNVNAEIARAIDRDAVLTPTYPLSKAETLRVNGIYGLKMEMIPESYRLQVVGVRGAAKHRRYTQDVTAWEYRYNQEKSDEDEGHDTKVDPAKVKAAELARSAPSTSNDSGIKTADKMAPMPMLKQAEQDELRTGRMPRGQEEAGESQNTLLPHTPGLLLPIEDLSQFPSHDLVTQFKCIEGWSQIVHWRGIRLADFLEAYPPDLIDGKEPEYVYMETPDGDYYTGYDIAACRHPQTLLVTEMMGAPLTQFHGAPLRIHMPIKYGYKQIKRIGLIAYTKDKPDCYWTELGYDWYAGL